MRIEELTRQIIDAVNVVHSALGPGFLESIYARALLSELRTLDLATERERQIKVWYGSQLVGKHCLDLIVEQAVVVELKANHRIIPIHVAQLRSYLQATAYPVGLLLNFGTINLQSEILHREKVAENSE